MLASSLHRSLPLFNLNFSSAGSLLQYHLHLDDASTASTPSLAQTAKGDFAEIERIRINQNVF
jgi:hypothetical protein